MHACMHAGSAKRACRMGEARLMNQEGMTGVMRAAMRYASSCGLCAATTRLNAATRSGNRPTTTSWVALQPGESGAWGQIRQNCIPDPRAGQRDDLY